MRPDLQKPTRAGWAALGGAAVVGAIALLVIGAGDGSGPALASAKQEYAGKRGRADFARQLRDQRQANDELGRTIAQLERDSGMSRNPYFVVPPGTLQRGYLYRDRFLWVQDQLRRRAKDRSVTINDDLGFATYAEGVPPEDVAENLLTYLQLVQKAVTIALSTTEANFVSLHVDPELKPVLSGQRERPLLREYPLSLTVKGPLSQILWVLHRFSQVTKETLDAQQASDRAGEADEDKAIHQLDEKLSRPSGMRELTHDEVARLDAYVVKRDFPLIITGLTIDGENTTEKGNIQQLTAIFHLAGMRFLDDAERAAATSAPAPGGRPTRPVAAAATPSPAAAPAAAGHRGPGGNAERFARP